MQQYLKCGEDHWINKHTCMWTDYLTRVLRLKIFLRSSTIPSPASVIINMMVSISIVVSKCCLLIFPSCSWSVTPYSLFYLLAMFFATEITSLRKDPRPLSAKKCIALFDGLQNSVAPDVFNPQMIYNGKKLAYCKAELFGAINVRAFLAGWLQTS